MKKDLASLQTLLWDDGGLYFDTISVRSLSRIPYLEFHLRKIRAVEKYIPSLQGKFVNFAKSKYLYSIVSQLMQVSSFSLSLPLSLSLSVCQYLL